MGRSRGRVQGVCTPPPAVMKLSSLYWLLKVVYLTGQWRHFWEVHPFLRKILDPPLKWLVLELLQHLLVMMCWFRFSTSEWLGRKKIWSHSHKTGSWFRPSFLYGGLPRTPPPFPAPWRRPGGTAATVYPGDVLPYRRLVGMCRWMQSNFYDWIDYHGSHFQ